MAYKDLPTGLLTNFGVHGSIRKTKTVLPCCGLVEEDDCLEGSIYEFWVMVS